MKRPLSDQLFQFGKRLIKWELFVHSLQNPYIRLTDQSLFVVKLLDFKAMRFALQTLGQRGGHSCFVTITC
jgi:hypothetical protein